MEQGRRHRRVLRLRDWGTRSNESEPTILRPASSQPPAWGDTGEGVGRFDQTNAAEQAWVSDFLSTGPVPGAVVELGCWLGGMTMAIAHGVSERQDRPVPVHVYDRFRFLDQGHIFAGSPTMYREGDSFRALFDQRLGDLGPVVEVHEGAVEDAEWDPRAPIGFLFNDVSKSWSTWRSVRRTFYRALRPGSIVVEQDFGHLSTPWLHLSHYRWRSYFEVVGAIDDTGSLVLRLRQELPTDELERDDLDVGFWPREIQEAFDWSRALVDPKVRPQVDAARVVLYLLHGDLRVAVSELLAAVDEGRIGGELAVGLVQSISAARTAGHLDPHSGSGTHEEIRRMIDAGEVERAVDACVAWAGAGSLPASAVEALLPELASADRRHRVESTRRIRTSVREALDIWGAARAARRRGDPWCAY